MRRTLRALMGCWWTLGLILVPGPAEAQNEKRCVFVWAPELKIEPTWAVENLASRPGVESDDQTTRAPRETIFELIFALDVPTTLPRIGLTFETSFTPFGEPPSTLFTGPPAENSGAKI